VVINGRDIRIDPWAVEYGAETPGASLPAEDDAQVDIAVECAGWRPITVSPSESGRPMLFVDGVRRIEQRLVVTVGERMLHGAIGSYGVGVVHAADGHAAFGNYRVGRLVIFGSGEHPGAALTLGPELVFEPIAAADDDPDAPVRALHAQMRMAEELFANGLASEEALVVVDGPLNISGPTAGGAVGFIKRLHRLYVPPAQLAVVSSLPAGARSPLFLIRSAGRFGRYAWFLRLGQPLRMESAFTGIVRLEIAESIGLDGALKLASEITARLPRFVPSRTRDPRAPQNLLPIGALEHYLRHQLGDARLIQRRLATFLATEPVNV
jgi:hypothetical protein